MEEITNICTQNKVELELMDESTIPCPNEDTRPISEFKQERKTEVFLFGDLKDLEPPASTNQMKPEHNKEGKHESIEEIKMDEFEELMLSRTIEDPMPDFKEEIITEDEPIGDNEGAELVASASQCPKMTYEIETNGCSGRRTECDAASTCDVILGVGLTSDIASNSVQKSNLCTMCNKTFKTKYNLAKRTKPNIDSGFSVSVSKPTRPIPKIILPHKVTDDNKFINNCKNFDNINYINSFEEVANDSSLSSSSQFNLTKSAKPNIDSGLSVSVSKPTRPTPKIILPHKVTDHNNSKNFDNLDHKNSAINSLEEVANDSELLVSNFNESDGDSTIFDLIENDNNLEELNELANNISSPNSDNDDQSDEEVIDSTYKRPNFIWNNVASGQYKAKSLQFTGINQANIQCQNIKSPLEIFKFVFNESIVKFIIDETNFFGEELFKNSQERNNANTYFRTAEWVKLTKHELFTYIGIIMYMSIKSFINIKDYWAKNLWGDKEIPKYMTRDRFLDIDRCLHFWNAGNINDLQGQLKLKKIKHLLNLLKISFSSAYNPSANLSLDESMIGWKGRLSFKTYIKSKNTRFGIKLYVLCDSSNGYYLNFIVYSGEDTPIDSVFANKMPSPTKTEKIVCTLIEPYIMAGHTLFMDNYYNSPFLCVYLRSKGLIDVVGTIRSNRKQLPSNIKKLKVDVNDTKDFVGKSLGCEVLLQKWAPKKGKYVHMISTKHNNDFMEQVKYNDVTVKKPVSVLDYNKSRGGVNKVDQMLQPYKMERPRGLRWTLKLFKRMLNITIHNCYIIHSSLNTEDNQMSNNDFRKKIVEEIFLESQCKQAKANNDQFVGVNHVMVSTKLSRNCWYCPKYRNIQRKRTVWICPSCNNIQLCRDPCFIDFHRKLWAGEIEL